MLIVLYMPLKVVYYDHNHCYLQVGIIIQVRLEDVFNVRNVQDFPSTCNAVSAIFINI